MAFKMLSIIKNCYSGVLCNGNVQPWHFPHSSVIPAVGFVYVGSVPWSGLVLHLHPLGCPSSPYWQVDSHALRDGIHAVSDKPLLKNSSHKLYHCLTFSLHRGAYKLDLSIHSVISFHNPSHRGGKVIFEDHLTCSITASVNLDREKMHSHFTNIGKVEGLIGVLLLKHSPFRLTTQLLAQQLHQR